MLTSRKKTTKNVSMHISQLVLPANWCLPQDTSPRSVCQVAVACLVRANILFRLGCWHTPRSVALTRWSFPPPKSLCVLIRSQIIRTECDVLRLQHAQDILYAIGDQRVQDLQGGIAYSEHTLTVPQSRLRRYRRQKDLNRGRDHGCYQ